MSDLSFTALDSVSELTIAVSSCSSPNSIISVSEIPSSIESSSLAPSGSSSSSVSSVEPNPLDSQSHLKTDETRNQSNASGGEATSPSDVMAQLEAGIGFLKRCCEDLAGSDSLPTTSTPTIVRGARRRLDVTPVEEIDSSQLEFESPIRPPPNRASDAVIDLCRHDRSQTPKRPQKEDAYKCPLCLDSVRMHKPVTTKCGHVFCKACIIAAISSVHKCPICNKKVKQRQFFRIYL